MQQAKVYFTDPVYARLEADVIHDAGVLSEQHVEMALWRSFERDRPGSCLGLDRVLYRRTRTAGRSTSSVPSSAAGPSSRSTSTAFGGGRADATCLRLARNRGHALRAERRRSRCCRPIGGAARHLTEPRLLRPIPRNVKVTCTSLRSSSNTIRSRQPGSRRTRAYRRS